MVTLAWCQVCCALLPYDVLFICGNGTMAATPRTVDAYMALVERCRTMQDVFRVLEDEIAREGYHSLIVASCDQSGGSFEVVFPEPAQAARRKLAADQLLLRAGLHTALLQTSQTTGSLLPWLGVALRDPCDETETDVPAFPLVRDAPGELTMPFHRAGDIWDIVGIKERASPAPEPGRRAIVKLKVYVTVQRHCALLALRNGANGKPSNLGAGPAHSPDHSACRNEISDQECRTLALVDVSWRRYSAGLLELNKRVPLIVGESLLQRYRRRGLIKEEADDLRFNYVFRPTRVGQNRLLACPQAGQLRDEVWTKYVHVHERPAE